MNTATVSVQVDLSFVIARGERYTRLLARAVRLEAIYADQMRRYEDSTSEQREEWRALIALEYRTRAQRIRRGLARRGLV